MKKWRQKFGFALTVREYAKPQDETLYKFIYRRKDREVKAEIHKPINGGRAEQCDSSMAFAKCNLFGQVIRCGNT